VNIDHIATVRQARGGAEPDPVAAAFLVELGGGDGITIHLREDRRHILDRDLRLLREASRLPLNLEMAAVEEMARIALATRPDEVTLVPERRQELTTEGGLDVAALLPGLRETVHRLKGGGLVVHLFIDPEKEQVEASKEAGADGMELHTGAFAGAKGAAAEEELQRLRRAACLGRQAGLRVHAGHGLNYQNVSQVAAIPEIEALNIGHSIVSRAIFVGLAEAVREMKSLIREAGRLKCEM
jgi:pyridoxine 5-phosphate synthase